MSDFRRAVGDHLRWIDTALGTGFSNFRFVDEHFRSSPVLRRIFSLARKLGYRSLVIDEISESASSVMSGDNWALSLRELRFLSSKVYRILFLRCGKDGQVSTEDLLGYAIFKENYFKHEPEPSYHVYEAVLKPCRPAAVNNFIHCGREYFLNTQFGDLSVKGVLYAQQNDLTFVCAHVALRTALASVLPEGDITYERMNSLMGIDHVVRKTGGGNGLSPEDLELVVRGCALPFHKTIHEPIKGLTLPGDFQRDLYGTIESGCPALLGFEVKGGRHIIPVIGHTFNEDTWVAESARAYFDEQLKYFPSENWLSTYVVHDDNFGPYYCLPRHYLKKDSFRISLGLQRTPTEIQAVDAEAVALVYLNALATTLIGVVPAWSQRFAAYADAKLLVLRTLLLNKVDYLDHLQKCECWDGGETGAAAVEKLHATLPEWFWMVECSAPELFAATRRKFGEILLKSDEQPPNPLDLSLMLACRLPGQITIFDGENLEAMDTGTKSHVCLFQFPSIFAEN